MIMAEPEPDAKLLDQVHNIYDTTNDEINLGLAELEMLVFWQLQNGSGLNKEVEINDKTYKLLDLYKHLDSVNQRLVEIVIKIAKKYNMDIPLSGTQTSKLQF